MKLKLGLIATIWALASYLHAYTDDVWPAPKDAHMEADAQTISQSEGLQIYLLELLGYSVERARALSRKAQLKAISRHLKPHAMSPSSKHKAGDFWHHYFLSKYSEQNPPRIVSAMDDLQSELDSCALSGGRKCCHTSGAGWLLDPTEQRNDLLKPLYLNAWLSLCAHTLQKIPETLQELKKVYGNYHLKKSIFTKEFHPESATKFFGRRIYRKNIVDHKKWQSISIAETLDPSCKVLETEVIFSSKNKQLTFLSFDQDGNLSPIGEFYTRTGEPSGKIGPKSCIGCHFRFNSKRIDVVRPRADNLGLRVFERDFIPDCIEESNLEWLTVTWEDYE